MASVRQLGPVHCGLLAARYASEQDFESLHVLLSLRRDAFPPEIALRILLTCLPEVVDPARYTSLIAVAAGLSNTAEKFPVEVNNELDISSVKEYSDSKAYKRIAQLHLLPLDHSAFPSHLADDLVTRFLVHRTHNIANNTGALNSIPQLLDPFLDDRPTLKTWFVSNVLPLLRRDYEYYPENDGISTLDQLELAGPDQAVEFLLAQSIQSKRDRKETEDDSALARDLRCLVGPWMYGAHLRKRRRMGSRRERRLSMRSTDGENLNDESAELDEDQQMEAYIEEQWDSALTWLTKLAAQDLQVIASAIEQWEGPSQVDLGGYDRNSHLDDQLQQRLESRYAQTAFAIVYAADSGSRDAISCAHSVLVRIADLMDLEPPPDLATSVDMLPRIDQEKGILEELTSRFLQPDALLLPHHPLTRPAADTFALLQLFIFSAYMLLEVNQPFSIIAAAKIRFQYDADEQMAVITRLLHNLTATSKLDADGWTGVRSRLIWLWGWALPRQEDGEDLGHGIFGKIKRAAFEKEILKSLINTGNYDLATKIYVTELDLAAKLSIQDVEQVIIATGLHHYDNASNGNRTRGGVKKALDIVNAFKRNFPGSKSFKRFEALIAATHSLSFYSLTLQHGVPFQPVNIRVSSDPIALIEKVLAQNPRSYAKLDDLISIATNLVAAAPDKEWVDTSSPMGRPQKPNAEEVAKQSAERRVIGMAIEAALTEDDFETAYSYVVNRLTVSSSSSTNVNSAFEDDLSWRAALAAGRHKSAAHTSGAPDFRRLEQRMDLLSQTLLLAPSNALPEVLNVWRKCEEELLALQASEAAEEEAFDRQAAVGQDLPGSFNNVTDFESLQQGRREIGRSGREEAPMGLFDVARGAAAAFSRSAFPLRQQTDRAGLGANAQAQRAGQDLQQTHSRSASMASQNSEDASRASGEFGRSVRKRDMVANAASGALASGIGWMLGATPVDR